MARFVTVIFGILALSVAGCSRSGVKEVAPTSPVAKSPAQPAKPKGPKTELSIRTSGVRELSWQIGGKYVLRASGEVLTADQASGKATFTNAKAELYQNGKKAALVSAKRLDADTNTGTLTATGGVVANSVVRNARLSVAQLVWNHKNARIVGQGGVRVISDVGSLSSDRIETNTQMTDVKLYAEKGGSASLNAAALE